MFKLIYNWTDKLKNKLNEKGQGMVEYGIVLAVVAAIAIAVFGSRSTPNTAAAGETSNAKAGTGLSGAVEGAYQKATDNIKSATDNN